ncbi:MAG: tyrosine-type recombinase/integrase [Thermoguttaceae bacterium]|nr:tyrosine-type recombinase/integrase [Thermoguttaceae bacterium]
MLPIVKVGAYSRKKRKGCKQDGAVCVVVFSDGSRKFINLGPYGSEDSLNKYKDLSESKRIEEAAKKKKDGTFTSELFASFLSWAENRINKGDFIRIRQTCQLAFEFAPEGTIDGFTALHFRAFIDHLQKLGRNPKARKGKSVWSRPYINKMISDIKRVFRWGVSWDLVTVEQRERVLAVPALRRRDTDAPERPIRRGVPDRDILAVLPYMEPVIRDMVCVQRGAAMRSKEVCTLKVGDLDKSAACWCVRSGEFANGMSNKTERFGTRRFIAFSVAETEILRRNCFGKEDDAFVFASDRSRSGSAGYTVSSYGHSIQAAIAKAQKDGKQVQHWTSYQLRHSGVTAISVSLGHETAQYAAGHTNPKTTEIYDHKAAIVSMDAASKRGGWWEEGK